MAEVKDPEELLEALWDILKDNLHYLDDVVLDDIKFQAQVELQERGYKKE